MALFQYPQSILNVEIVKKCVLFGFMLLMNTSKFCSSKSLLFSRISSASGPYERQITSKRSTPDSRHQQTQEIFRKREMYFVQVRRTGHKFDFLLNEYRNPFKRESQECGQVYASFSRFTCALGEYTQVACRTRFLLVIKKKNFPRREKGGLKYSRKLSLASGNCMLQSIQHLGRRDTTVDQAQRTKFHHPKCAAEYKDVIYLACSPQLVRNRSLFLESWRTRIPILVQNIQFSAKQRPVAGNIPRDLLYSLIFISFRGFKLMEKDEPNRIPTQIFYSLNYSDNVNRARLEES